MSGPIEDPPFRTPLAATQRNDGSWTIRDVYGAFVASITADADRVEEIVRLINAQPKPA